MAATQAAQAVAHLERENAELRARLQASTRCEPHGDVELVSETVLVPQAPEDDDSGEFACFPNLIVDDAQGASKDAIFQRLQRERVVLLCDLNSVKAKFQLTLQTLRSVLRLGAEATWADVLEHAEALGNSHYSSGHATPGARAVTDAEAEQAELERESLEENLSDKTGQIARLRELLQKQQRLLDLTAGQIQEQHQQSKKQAEQHAISELKQANDQEVVDAQAEKIDALTSHSERLNDQLQIKHDHATQLEETLLLEVQQRDEVCQKQETALKREADRIADLREHVASREADAKRHKDDSNLQKQIIKDLTESLTRQTEDNEVLRDKVEVHEQAHTRRLIYSARTPDDRKSQGPADDGGSPDSARPSQPSARGLRSARQEQSNGSLLGYSAAAGAAAGPASYAGGSQASAPSSVRGAPQSARQVVFDDDERDAFLSQFPMAQRTERNLRNRIESDRKKKVTSQR